MKKLFNTLFLVLCLFNFSNIYLLSVKALEKEDLQLYPIRDEKIINNVLSFYQNNNKTIIRIVENKNRFMKEQETKYNTETEILEKENNTINKENEDNLYQEIANFDSKYTDLANYALQFVGNPYVYGGTSLTEGTDCSGFVMKLYENYGVNLPRTSGEQATVGYSVPIQNAQPGDIISYGYNGIVSHSAIYIGNEMIVHASTPEGGIKIDGMYIMPIITIRRIG